MVTFLKGDEIPPLHIRMYEPENVDLSYDIYGKAIKPIVATTANDINKTSNDICKSSNELCETPKRNFLQTETTTPELGEFVKNAVETSTPINRKLPLQEMEMEKDPDTVSMVNPPKKWRLSGLRRTRTSSKK
ncbi:hypothetical protein GQX74_010607 [Glossina fuscipes]|nr:hypothetical protein GQX74_010607 [Glossina fuscipes]